MASTNLSHKPQESGSRLLRFTGVPSTNPSVPAFYEDAQPHHFIGEHIAIFIHGLTKDSSYLSTMMASFANAGITPLAFNYPSLNGIDKAAADLASLLTAINVSADGKISSSRKIVLVCHSSGGLIGRALISFYKGNQFVRRVVTLGTPHDATLTDSSLIRCFITLGEYYTGLTTGGYSSSCRSALQLTKQDSDGPYLEKLLNAMPEKPDVEFLSISGGRNMLKFGENLFRNRLINAFLQWKLGPGRNDGLVSETSSDFSDAKFRSCAPKCVPHFGLGTYDEYDTINHSFMIENQRVILEAANFVKGKA